MWELRAQAAVMRAWDGDMGLTEGWNGTKVPLCLLCKDALDTSPASPWDADPHEVFDAAKDHPESCQCPVCRLRDLVYGRFWDELALLPQHCQAEFAALLNRAGMYNTVETGPWRESMAMAGYGQIKRPSSSSGYDTAIPGCAGKGRSRPFWEVGGATPWRGRIRHAQRDYYLDLVVGLSAPE